MSDPSTAAPSPDVPPWRRRRPVVLSSAAFLLVSLLTALLPGTAAAQLPQTVVSLTFDDGNADQLPAAQTLQAAGMKGTFYIPSGLRRLARLPDPRGPDRDRGHGARDRRAHGDPPRPDHAALGRGEAADLRRPGQPDQLGIPGHQLRLPVRRPPPRTPKPWPSSAATTARAGSVTSRADSAAPIARSPRA